MRNITLAILMSAVAAPLAAGEPIPDKLVVLTFDDGCKSHFTVVRPILKKYEFGATFFITEGFDFRTNKRRYMQHLAQNNFTVIAIRDLARYVNPEVTPRVADFVITQRKRTIESGGTLDNFRRPKDDADLRSWLQNMVWHHRFAAAEIRAATGLTMGQVTEALQRFDIRPETKPQRPADAPLLVLPYPGGRHPRIGFLDGAVRPQRETKISIFTPWDDRSYIVLDVPEAIRRNDERQHGLLYLAHTHVDTMWTKRGVELEKLEWRRHSNGSLTMERKLPNHVVFGTKVMPRRDAVTMEMWLTNGSDETLSNLRVQNCIMLKGAPEFSHSAEETTVHSKPYVARRSRTGNRWIITAWAPCFSTWFNPPCPCMHSDPQFPDCEPGQTKTLKGWLSFYEGDNIDAELKRIDSMNWR